MHRSRFRSAPTPRLTIPPRGEFSPPAVRAILVAIFGEKGLVVNLMHCIYASRASANLDDAEIQDLLTRARAKNVALGITGMLLLIDGSFFQVLEGETVAVDKLYEVIEHDARHDRVTQIIREPIAQRSFAEWSMGFAAVGRGDAQRLIGENDFFGGADCLENIQPGRARKLLVAFGGGRWRTEHTGAHRAHARVR